MFIQILRVDLPTVKIDSDACVPFDIRFPEDTVYMLQTDCGYVPVYCQMTNSGMGTCGGGGWTLVMKIDD